MLVKAMVLFAVASLLAIAAPASAAPLAGEDADGVLVLANKGKGNNGGHNGGGKKNGGGWGGCR